LIDGVIDTDERVVVDLASAVGLKDRPTQQTVLINQGLEIEPKLEAIQRMSARRGQWFIGRLPRLLLIALQPGVELVEQIGQIVTKASDIQALEWEQRAYLSLPRCENLL